MIISKKIHLQKLLNNKRNILFFAIFIAFIFRIVFAFWTWHPDVTNHIDWGTRFFEYTPVGFYAPDANVWNFTWPNQPPGTIYIFAIVRFLFENIFNFLLFINNSISIFPSIIVSFSETNLYPAMLQKPAILADFAIAYIIYKITKSKYAGLIFLFNPVIFYNSSVWGQYDSVINLLLLIGFYLAEKKKLLLSIIAVALSLYIKVSLVILLPVYAVYILRKFDFIKILKSSFIAFIFIILLTIPFSGEKNPVFWLYKLYTDRVLTEQLHLITANAFNFWGFVRGVDWVPNSEPLLGKTYEFWGLVLFAFTSIPLYIKAFMQKDLKKTLFITAMIYFSAWMFLTNMHERYLYPFFVFSLPLIINQSKKIYVYLLLGALSTFNMYYLWFVPRFDFLIIFSKGVNKQLISFLFLLIFIYFYRQLFNLPRKRI